MRPNPGKELQAPHEKTFSFFRIFYLLIIISVGFSFDGSLLMAQTTTYLKMEEEFARLHPDQAVADAQRDIKEQTIKLFFEDRSEYPEILAIDENLTRYVRYAHISIGQGCLDPINDDSCPVSYQESYLRALQYGRLYNQVIASHFESNSKAPGKSDSIQQDANETALFLARSPEHALSMFVAGKLQDFPGSPCKHDTMHIGYFLNQIMEIIVCTGQIVPRQRDEGFFGHGFIAAFQSL
jgi:hypothetical protein